MNLPSWDAGAAHSSLNLMQQSEMRRREAQAIVSISRIARMQREAHDSGDGALIHHCPFCGSGAVSARSDGGVDCDFCNSTFTVQVQPNHPFQPQTIDGQPTPPPGMPAGSDTEMSGTDDPAVNEAEDGVAANPLDDQGGPPSNGPVKPGQPPAKQPNPFAKADPATNPGKGQDGADTSKKPNPFAKQPSQPGAKKPDDGKKKDLPPWLKKKTFRTHTGAALDAEAYMQSLALAHADDREAVLDMVRVANLQRQEAMPPFLAAGGLIRHQVRASEVAEGDYLDISGKVRVHQTMTRNGQTTLAYRVRGSKAPGIRRHPENENVYVWRRE